MTFFTVLHQVIIMFLLMLAGFIVYKIGLLSEEATKGATQLLLLFVSPAAVMYSFQIRFSSALLRGLLISAASAVGIHIFSILLGLAIFRNHPVNRQLRTVMRFAIVYSNCGFMGIPLLSAMIGPRGIFYASVYSAVYNIFSWTHGSAIYRSDDAGGTNCGEKSLPKGKVLLNILLNPNIIAVGVGLVLFCLSLRLPSVLHESVGYVYNLFTPLAMILMGCRMAQVNFKTILNDKWVWPGVMIKNLILPLLAAFALHFAGVSGELMLACLIPIACPVGGLTVLMADMYGVDTSFPSKLMSLSTLLSIATIPFIVFIVSYLHL